MNGLMTNKTVVVMGVANERSIAWGVARALHREGAKLIFTYRKERSYQKLQQLSRATRSFASGSRILAAAKCRIPDSSTGIISAQVTDTLVLPSL